MPILPGGLKCLRMRAAGEATIDIVLQNPEPVAQCIGVAMGDDKAGQPEAHARELWDMARTGNSAAVGRLLSAGSQPE